MRYSLLLAAAGLVSAASAATTKCTKDVAKDYSKIMTADVPTEDIEATLSQIDVFVDLNIWNFIDEIDGKTGGIKKNTDFSCTPIFFNMLLEKALTSSRKYRQLRRDL